MSNIIDSRPYIFFAYSVIGFAVFNIKKFGQEFILVLLIPIFEFFYYFESILSQTLALSQFILKRFKLFLCCVSKNIRLKYIREKTIALFGRSSQNLFFANLVFKSSKNPSFSKYLI